MKIVKQWYFWLAVVFAVMLRQQIASPRELAATRWTTIILAAISIPLQLFTAYQKSREKKDQQTLLVFFCKGGDS